jgi:hypothetical protein
MAESPNIFFVTWPDGKVDSESLNVASKDIAKARLIRTWLPEQWFGDMKWLEGYALNRLWEGMVEKGFKVHHIKTGADGNPIINES